MIYVRSAPAGLTNPAGCTNDKPKTNKRKYQTFLDLHGRRERFCINIVIFLQLKGFLILFRLKQFNPLRLFFPEAPVISEIPFPFVKK